MKTFNCLFWFYMEIIWIHLVILWLKIPHRQRHIWKNDTLTIEYYNSFNETMSEREQYKSKLWFSCMRPFPVYTWYVQHLFFQSDIVDPFQGANRVQKASIKVIQHLNIRQHWGQAWQGILDISHLIAKCRTLISLINRIRSGLNIQQRWGRSWQGRWPQRLYQI